MALQAELLASFKELLAIVEEDLQYARHAGQNFPHYKQLDKARAVVAVAEMFEKLSATKPDLNASEALYGFMGWLNCTDRFTNCALGADLVDAFCKVNNLPELREGCNKRIVWPDYPEKRKVFPYEEPVPGDLNGK